jgi:hypothetical protein
MALSKLAFKPGVNKDQTNYSSEGGWFEMDKVRFRSGFPEKLGGWVVNTNNQYVGVGRAVFPWFTTDGYGSFYIGPSWTYLTVPNPTGFFKGASDIRNHYEARHSDTGKRADIGFRNGGTDVSDYFQPGGNGYDSGFRSGSSSLGSLFS